MRIWKMVNISHVSAPLEILLHPPAIPPHGRRTLDVAQIVQFIRELDELGLTMGGF